MIERLPLIEFLTTPSDGFGGIFKCTNCRHRSSYEKRIQKTKGILWWKKKYHVCEVCGSKKYVVLMKYKVRNV